MDNSTEHADCIVQTLWEDSREELGALRRCSATQRLSYDKTHFALSVWGYLCSGRLERTTTIRTSQLMNGHSPLKCRWRLWCVSGPPTGSGAGMQDKSQQRASLALIIVGSKASVLSPRTSLPLSPIGSLVFHHDDILAILFEDDHRRRTFFPFVRAPAKYTRSIVPRRGRCTRSWNISVGG